MAGSQKDPLVGTKIREYQITELLGKGGMGAVYRARHVYLDEDRAIKVIHGRLAGDTDFVERFIREARILTKLHHPNLVQLYEFGTLEQDTFFMVMEFIHGESVLQRIKRLGRIPVTESLRIIRQAALGLSSAHQKGIIHRDISPDNLILLKDNDGREVTKIIDFGIAKPLFESSSQHFTLTNLFIGKPEYCSPEQCGVLEEGEIIDARSDIYSLAVTLYHMLAGRLPFYSSSPQGYLLKHASEIPKAVSSLFPSEAFPVALDRVILKALTKKREERYASMDEFVQDLDSATPSDLAVTAEVLPHHASFSEFRPGELFAKRYLIERKLGQGGMGAVYKALDRILDVPVALKIMSGNIVHDQKTVERFKREVILARKVAHPHVCRIFDMGESGEVHYVSMEFLEGKTLSEMIQKEGRLSPELGIPLLKQVLSALQEAHRVGIVHRDLKPQNIMVDPDSKAHIMDFGISISSDVHRVTQTGALIGTPHYMAPEQFEGNLTDHRADIYAIGIIMFEMFTGRLPFDAATPVAIIFAHLKSEPPKPSEIVSGFSPQLERIILKALQKDVKSRYQTVRELLHELEPLAIPTTSTGAFSREQIAHKLIAEQSFSRAIKFLNHLLKADPENKQWKKLLNVASTERVNRDIRRTKHLIHKKNLIQAQLLLEKINRYRPGGTRITNQLKKVQFRLNEEREKAIQGYVTEAEQLLTQRNWAGAMTSLESAWNLKQNDQRIVQLQEQAQALQQKEQEHNLHTQLDEAKAMLKRGDAVVALTVVEDLLKESPTFEPAKTLHSEITDLIRLKAEEERLRPKVDAALQLFGAKDFAQSALVLEMLAAEAKEEAFRKEIERIRHCIHAVAVASRKDQTEEMSAGIERLLNEDPYHWLRVHEKAITSLKVEAESAGERGKQFRTCFDAAKRAYDDSRWEESIRLWEEALKFRPEDRLVLELITAARKQLEIEKKIVAKVQGDLVFCERFINERRFQEARGLLNGARESVLIGAHSESLQRKITELGEKLDRELEREEKRLKAIQGELARISQHYKNNALQQAMEEVSSLLGKEPQLIEALRLKETIENGIREQERIAASFKTTFEKGRAFFEQMKWEEAIGCLRQAYEMVADPVLQQWISAAESRLSAQQQLRSDLANQLIRSKKLIQEGNYSQARRLLDSCAEKTSQQFYLDDLREELAELNGVLEAEVERENVRRKSREKSLGESTRLFEEGKYQEALVKVEALLQQQPDMDAALRLNDKIQIALKDKQLYADLVSQLGSALELLRVGRPQEFSEALKNWQTSARRSGYESDVIAFAEDLTAFAYSLTSDVSKARSCLEKMAGRSGQFRLDENQVRMLQSLLAETKRKEAEFDALLQEAMQQIHSRKWDQAVDLFQRLSNKNAAHSQVLQYFPLAKQKAQELAAIRDKLQSISSKIEKHIAAHQWDEAIRTAENALSANYSDLPVESQVGSLKDRRDHAFAARTKNALEEAARASQAGNLSKAEQLYKKVLTWEPLNATAQLGLGKFEATIRQQEAGLGVTGIPVSQPRSQNWFWIAISALVLFVFVIGIWLAPKLWKAPSPAPVPAGPVLSTVTINALPWARVKLTPVSKEIKLPAIGEEELVTPCQFSIPSGEYILDLSNGSSQLQERITVSQGAANDFAFYVMGDYNPQDVVAQIGAKK